MHARWLLLAGAFALAGCAASPFDLFDRGSDDEELARDGELAQPFDAETLGIYLQVMRDLVAGDSVVQVEVFRDVEYSAQISPTTSNRLRFALALATPGHPSSDPARAQRLLNDLLAMGDTLLPEERTLAMIHLKEVEQRLILDAEARQLQQQAIAQLEQQNSDNQRQLAAALEENRQLRSQLEEAQQKLDAITSIERSIRERDNGTESP